jgi:mRNA-degrading endonuclease toxin of MazEF toxin-antitoxin module
VVSRDAINFRMKVVVADVTSSDRERELPTCVLIEPSDENGLAEESFVVCHELATVVRGRLDSEPVGRLSPSDLWSVDDALRFSVGLSDEPPRRR